MQQYNIHLVNFFIILWGQLLKSNASLCHSSLAYERDTGSKSFLEDLFECEERLPGMNWKPAALRWTDIVSILPELLNPLSQNESK